VAGKYPDGGVAGAGSVFDAACAGAAKEKMKLIIALAVLLGADLAHGRSCDVIPKTIHDIADLATWISEAEEIAVCQKWEAPVGIDPSWPPR